jgi:hypothetical protein
MSSRTARTKCGFLTAKNAKSAKERCNSTDDPTGCRADVGHYVERAMRTFGQSVFIPLS